MGFGRTEKERQLALIANARHEEKLLINDLVMVRTDDIRKYHDPSQSFIYTFNAEGFDFCEVYIRVRFKQSDGNLSLLFERRNIDEYVDGQIVYYKEREQDWEEIRSVREVN
jgi:hypothetical protein